MDIIKIVNSKEKDNYLISPYSMEIALNMLKEGADGESFNQIDKVIPTRNITVFNVKNRISVANALFIKDSEKSTIYDSYISKLKTSYNADLIYDKFTTPNKINNWVEEKTYKMIPKILDSIPKDFVLGMANAVAIDVNWSSQFECNRTVEDSFTTPTGVKKVEMMNRNFSQVEYIKNDDEIGIILPYFSYTKTGEVDYEDKEESTRLEFVAIMPTKKDVRTYINDLTPDLYNNVINSKKSLNENQEVRLSLPRFEYDFDDQHFMYDLIDLGIKDVFDQNLANLSKISKNKLYVSQAIHMTHISLNEKGTKAAAVTYFGLEKSAAAFDEKQYIDIKFDKPFMYIIRDSKTKEMLFFGVVESPNEWKGTTCSEK